MRAAVSRIAPTVLIDLDEFKLLRASAADKRIVSVIVNGCAYSCCGRGWQRRDGYEQHYRGWVDNLTFPIETDHEGTFMLYSPGIGTLAYVIAARFSEVEAVSE